MPSAPDRKREQRGGEAEIAALAVHHHDAGADLVDELRIGGDGGRVRGGPARHHLLDEIVVALDRELVAGERAALRPVFAIRTGPSDAKALPWIFLEVADRDVELHAAHKIDHLEPCAVELVGDRQHHRRRHARRPQALVPVAQRRIEDPYVFL